MLSVNFMVLVICRVRLSFTVRFRDKARFTFMHMARFSVRFRFSVWG